MEQSKTMQTDPEKAKAFMEKYKDRMTAATTKMAGMGKCAADPAMAEAMLAGKRTALLEFPAANIGSTSAARAASTAFWMEIVLPLLAIQEQLRIMAS